MRLVGFSLRRNIKASIGAIAILLGFLLGRVVLAQDGPLTVTITGSPTVGPTTLTTSFASVPVGGTPPYTYTWVWGDGTANGTTQNPSHNFTVAGVYTTILTVTDSASHTASQVKTVLATGTPYYVAKSGSDSNNGLTPSTAFLTLTKCQTAMQDGSTKVCTINDSGTYTLSAQMTFGSADNGETWTAGFGKNPIIDGNSSQYNWNANAASSMSFYGLTFQNMGIASGEGGTDHGAVNIGNSGDILRWNTVNPNTNNGGIAANFTNLSNTLIDSNTFNGGGNNNVTGTSFQSDIGIGGPAAGGPITITHNLCQNGGGACVEQSGVSNNTTIAYNLALNMNQHCGDCGAYYAYASHTSAFLTSGNVIEYNADYTNTDPKQWWATCVYLDEGTQGWLVKGNTCTSYDAGTNGGHHTIGVDTVFPIEGLFCLHVGNGNNTATNNICEVAGIPSFSGYSGTYFWTPPFNAGTVITNNIVFTRSTSPVWQGESPGGMCEYANAVVTVPSTISGNDYYSETAATFPPANYAANWVKREGAGSTATCKDSSYVTTNPGFVSPATNNYQVTNPPPGWQALPTNQGPVNSPFQAAGSTF